MIIPGLCSISFRQLKAEEIIDLCLKLKIPAIEWGGDIHVPHGDVFRAAELAKLCNDAGICCPSYGSYYKVGESEAVGLFFDDVLASAKALGVQTIRVWGGSKNFTEYSADELASAVADIRRIADMTAAAGMTLSFEYHENTLTHIPEAVLALDKAVNHPAIRFYWQPPHVFNDQACLNSLLDLGDKLSNIHVFQWILTEFREDDKRIDRRPLSEGVERWSHFFAALPRDENRFGFMEFVRGDDPEQLQEDWNSYLEILKNLN